VILRRGIECCEMRGRVLKYKQKDDYKKDMKEGRLQNMTISRRGVQGRITRHARNYASA